MEMPKYSRMEIERRWLVSIGDVGPFDSPFWDIEDLYIAGTQLRLRRMESPESGIVYKLCKKYGKRGGVSEPITNLYLSESEYDALRNLPGNRVRKRRYRVEGGGLDLYNDRNPVVAIFEVEFESEDSARAYSPPSFALREITGNPEFSGESLADH
jgi:CYTH domain-containing protein